MHHFIYPSKDTYITNRTGFETKNFGLDELLQIGTLNKPISYLSSTKDYIYTSQEFVSYRSDSFSGSFTGSFTGTISLLNGIISGSSLYFTSSYFSGSINGTIQEGSGSISGDFDNVILTGSGNFPSQSGIFQGNISNLVGCMTGTGSGIDTHNDENITTRTSKFIDRTLLQFDITSISESILRGEISNPRFSLKLKICNEYELPITYTIYALPISQSWNMGDGNMADGGSDEGVNWEYRDNSMGTEWYLPTISEPRSAIDFINNLSLNTASYGFGGGTWYTQSIASQSFSYESSDINMDVTDMVMGWISGSFPNQGLILIHSDELISTGSGFVLTFYSSDTNTIYSPYVDVMWNDNVFSTGSISTSSVNISTMSSGITSSIQSGSSFSINGGISGSFSSSAMLTLSTNYITASNQIFNYSSPNSSISNDTWYANNGYHYDSWQTAWQLDPHHGGFLPNTDIQIELTPPDYGTPPIHNFSGSFTGSFIGTASVYGTFTGSGEFSASYFSGSLNGISSIISGSVSSSNIQGFVSSSVIMAYHFGEFIGTMSSSLVYLNGTGSGTYQDDTYFSFNGFIDGTGLTGNITNIPIFGSVSGLIAISQSLITGSCGKSFYASLAKAILKNGPFSGSAFSAFYTNYAFVNAILTGSWTESSLIGTNVYIPIPSGREPYAYATVIGNYISGKALGLYTVSGSSSASFDGQFINGNLLGGHLIAQLSGNVYTSSFLYTSSISTTSSYLSPLDSSRPFSIVLQGVKSTYKSGDVARIGVFGRKQYPLKQFGMSSQQEQYIIPEYLPTSSFYALKDNQTDEIVLDFDSYTQISCEYPKGNYFFMDTSGLPQERYYRVLVRVQNSEETYTIDTGKTFKIIR